MATAKTTTLTFRIEPNIKEALCTAADRDLRSIANMVAVMIREHCGRHNITISNLDVLEDAKGLVNASKKKSSRRSANT